MTTNLKIEIDSKDDIKLTSHSSLLDNSILTFKLIPDTHSTGEYLQTWDNNATSGTNGFYDSFNKGFSTSSGSIMSDLISYVKITGPTIALNTIHNLVLFKDDIKDIGAKAKGELSFELTIDKNINDTSDHWDITSHYEPSGASGFTLNLSVADFGGSLNSRKISIDDTEYHHDPDNKIKILEKRRDQKGVLLNLENLLAKLPAQYSTEQGPDADLTDPKTLLGTFADSSTVPPTPATGLASYFHSGASGSFPKEPNNPKHILFDLTDSLGNPIYKTELNKWIEELEKINFFYNLGLIKKSQIFIVNSNDGGGWKDTDTELKDEPGFFLGFQILDPNLKVTLDSSNKFKIEKINPDKPVRYTKEKIDDFRRFGDNYYHDPNDNIFAKEKTIPGKDGHDVQVFANRKVEECFGFQPGDIIYKAGNYAYINGEYLFEEKSKIHYDILSAQNAEEAMDLAFFGKDYDFAQSDFDDANRKKNPNKSWTKNPNVNLKFNEVKEWSRLDHLKHYYKSLKDSANCVWRNPGDSVGHGATDASKYDDPTTQKKIDKGYELAEEFVTDYENYINTNISSLNKTQLESIKAKLQKYKNTQFYESGGVWTQVIKDFLDEVNGALSLLNEDPDDDVPTWKTELAGLKNRGNELAQKIYQNCQPDQDGFTETVFKELEKLVKLLEETYGAKQANTKSELEKFISDISNDANKRKALEIAKKVKNQDSDSEDCIATALEKLKTPSEKQLEKARQKLKSLLIGLKINDKNAYEEIISGVNNSEKDINKIIQIWQKCQEINNATNDDKSELLDALNNLKNDISNKKAWEAVNKYKKDSQSQGLCNDMLKKLNEWAEQQKKDHLDIKNAKSKTEFQATKEKFMKNHEYQNDKQNYDEIYFPLAEKAAEIREKGAKASPEEKELLESITTIVSDYTDWKTQLADLENKLSKLEKYAEDGEKNYIIKNFSLAEQTAFKKLISKIKDKVKEWKFEKSKSEKNDLSQENSPWIKMPIVITGIILLILLVISGTIYYFFSKQNISKEE